MPKTQPIGASGTPDIDFPRRFAARAAFAGMRSMVAHKACRSLVGPIAVAATLWGMEARARAQAQASHAATTPAAPTVDPPRLVSSPEVAYPATGQGEAEVILLLTVQADGTVKGAQAVRGEEPFRTAAESAAAGWRFEPARRNGQAVAARIRFLVHFTPPSPPPLEEPIPSPPGAQPPSQQGQPANGAAPGATTPTTPPAPATTALPETKSPPAQQPIEVVVKGNRPAPGASSMGRAEVRQLPGAFGDPFRAIESMPGVTPIVSGLPFFYVRGAPPGNVGYFFDGVRVPYLYHVGLGPSVIHPGLVDRVDLYPGGYPAQYGRYAGGIVSAESTEPRADLHGEGNIRLFDMGALAETGYANGRGTVLLAGRYSYTAAILSLIAKNTTLDYRDFEARTTYDFTDKDRVTLFGFGSYDLLQQTTAGVTDTLFGSEFYRLDTRYDHRYGPGSAIRAAVTLGFDQTRVPGQPRNQRDYMVSARLQGTHKLSGVAQLRGGADITLDAYRADVRPYADPEDPDTIAFNEMFPPRDDVAVGGWTDVVLTWRGVEVTPGVRVDLYRSGSASAVGIDPRISSRLEVARGVHVIHTFGIAHQPPSFIIPIPGLAIGNLSGGLQTSVQSSAGVEVELPGATTATATVFENIFLNMTDTLGVRQEGQGGGPFSQARSLGSTYGAELYIKRRLTRRLGGYLAYTLSRSMRSVGQDHFPSSFDRTHVANAAVAYDLGRNWRAGTRLTLYTGAPQTDSGNPLIPLPKVANPPRDPMFYRIDVRLEKRWNYSNSRWLSFVAEMLNATLHKEVLMGHEIGPVSIPSIGLEGGL